MILCLNYGHIFENYTYPKNLGSDLMQIKIILSVMVLFSVVFLVPSDAFGELIVAQTQSKVKVAQQNWYNDSWNSRWTTTFLGCKSCNVGIRR